MNTVQYLMKLTCKKPEGDRAFVQRKTFKEIFAN